MQTFPSMVKPAHHDSNKSTQRQQVRNNSTGWRCLRERRVFFLC